MANLIISKKGKALIFFLVITVFCLVAGIWFLANPADDFGTDDEFETVINVVTPMCLFGAAALFGVAFYATTKSHIYIYDDHIEGTALLNSRPSQFNLKKGEYTINKENNRICINSMTDKFQIWFDAADANEIYQILTNGRSTKAQYDSKATQNAAYRSAQTNNYQKPPVQSAAYQKVNSKRLFSCTACKTMCSVPAGRGHIRITCPKCGNKFDVNS